MWVVLVKVDDEITGVVGPFESEDKADDWVTTVFDFKSTYVILEITDPY